MRTTRLKIWPFAVACWLAGSLAQSTGAAEAEPASGFNLSVVSSPTAALTTTTQLDAELTFAPNGRSMSDNGRYVVFSTSASNLSGSTGTPDQAYLFDESTGSAQRLNRGTANATNVVISGNGEVTAYTESPAQPERYFPQIVITDHTTGSAQPLTQLLGRTDGSMSSWDAALSADGRFIAFLSDASDLVANDTNEAADLFVLDRQSAELTRVSVATDGTQGEVAPTLAVISDSGDVVSFTSTSQNLVAGDTNRREDVFYHLRATGETRRLEAVQRDSTATTYPVRRAVMSGNGQYFAFVSQSDLLANGIRSGVNRVYRHDRVSGTTELASLIEPVSADIDVQLRSATTASISSDGQSVGFITDAGFTRRDFIANTLTTELDLSSAVLTHNRYLLNLTMSADANAIVLSTVLRFSGNINRSGVVSYHYRIGDDRPMRIDGSTIEVATADDESTSGGDGNVSGDGRFVVFATRAAGYTQSDTFEQHIVLADTLNGTRLVLTQGQALNDERVISSAAVISDSGSHVVFESTANRFAQMTEAADDDNGASDLFVYELATGQITHASQPHPTLSFPSRAYRNPDLSADGRYLSFNSSSSNINQDQGVERVYRLDRHTGDVVLVSKTLDGTPNNGRASRAKISANGQTIAFVTASPLLLNQTGNEPNQAVFVWRAGTGETRQIVAPTPTQIFGKTIALSGNGRFIAYTVRASLEPTRQWDELWQHDLLTSTSQLIEEGELLFIGSSTGVDQPVMSHDGRYLGFRVIQRPAAPSAFAPFPASLYRTDRLSGERKELTGNLSNLSRTSEQPTNSGISGDGSAVVFGNADPLVNKDINGVSDVFISKEIEPSGNLVSAVLPSSRSARVNETSTAYATLIASTDMTACELKLANDTDIQFSWQVADLAAGLLLGTANIAFDVQANTPTPLLLSLQANSPILPTELVFDAWCANGQAATAIVGLNTLEFSAANNATADVVALTASVANDGTVAVPSDGDYGFFSLATVNVGASGAIVVVPAVSEGIDGKAVICQTSPTDGGCVAEPSSSVTIQMAADQTATFAVFVRAEEPVAFDPARNRVNVTVIDSAGVNRGRTSLALR